MKSLSNQMTYLIEGIHGPFFWRTEVMNYLPCCCDEAVMYFQPACNHPTVSLADISQLSDRPLIWLPS